MSLSILYPALTLGGLGLIFGILLSYASKKFEIQLNPKIEEIKSVLPGANCGGCGYPGCDAYSRAIVEEGAPANLCGPGGIKALEAISSIIGMEVVAKEKNVAFVRCQGSCSKTKIRNDYEVAHDCYEAAEMSKDGSKGCQYGCFGLGSCFDACKFDAIIIEDGIARVDEEKCTNCGACIKACPRGLIESVPVNKKIRVACMSKDAGKIVRENCSIGCIGCKICEKNCQYDAVHVVDNIAKIDYAKCTQCQVCKTKCPTKAIC